MAVKIRLVRCGIRHLAVYDIVVADARSPLDGRFIEKIGSYNPNTAPAAVALNETSALKWLFQSAQPTDSVKSPSSKQGIMLKKHLQIGVIKGAITREQADEKFASWKVKSGC